MPPKAGTKRKAAELDASAGQPASTPASNGLTLDFMTLPRPMFDFHRQYDPEDIEGMSKAKVDRLQKNHDAESKLHFKKDPKDFPGWAWIISKHGHKMFQKMDIDVQKRDQDRFGMHIYSDWTGYGVQEILENWVSTLWLISSAC